jgi:hypothetical protein
MLHCENGAEELRIVICLIGAFLFTRISPDTLTGGVGASMVT